MFKKNKFERILKERINELEWKIIEIEEKNRQLEEQSRKFQEMEALKSRFFADISRDFRTPLTLIMGPLEQMLSESKDDRRKEELKVILHNSQRLLTSINQLLDLSRFDTGQMKLEAACQNIVPFLEGILASFQMLAQQNNLDIVFQSKEKDISLYFDTQKMEEVMYNLLFNAVKFTPGGGKIVVAVSKENNDSLGFVKISIQNTGIGFPKEHSDYIFDRFYQAANLKEEGYTGSGIGLALTKEIILLHHGTIDAHSREEKETEFVIRLPLGNKHLSLNEIITLTEATSAYKKSQEGEKFFMAAVEEGEPDTETVEKIEPSMLQNTILVIDDNTIFRKYIRGRLESTYRVVEAISGQEGIRKAKETIPDLIISDIAMPGIDGFELCNALKKDISTSHIPIILLTGKAAEEDIIKGLKTGADDYITKPPNTKILIARIKNLIERRCQLRSEKTPSSSLDEDFLKKCREIIERNLTKPDLNEDQLCLELQLSQDVMFKKLQALTGETPNQFILSYRLERAAQLLKANFGNVTEVAFEVGFPNTAEFARCFKEKFQQLPTSFQTFHQSPSQAETNGE
ncbi:MAG: response regulator [Candidatus Aminicenantes bacterium]|nr:response regulator [Candidatus Aminicenantes bacterium]